jgi:KaiC/GvpD/RAD55 family RecA-like ATPase
VKVGDLVRIKNSSLGDDSLGIVVRVNKYNDTDPKNAVHLVCIESERLWFVYGDIEVVSESR